MKPLLTPTGQIVMRDGLPAMEDCADICCAGGCYLEATLCSCSGSSTTVAVACDAVPHDARGTLWFSDSVGNCYTLSMSQTPASTPAGSVVTPVSWYLSCENCCNCVCPSLPPDAPSAVLVEIDWTIDAAPSGSLGPLAVWSSTVPLVPVGGDAIGTRRYWRPDPPAAETPCHGDEAPPNALGCPMRYAVIGAQCSIADASNLHYEWLVIVIGVLLSSGDCLYDPDCPPTSGPFTGEWVARFRKTQPRCDPPPVTGVFPFFFSDSSSVTAGTLTVS